MLSKLLKPLSDLINIAKSNPNMFKVFLFFAFATFALFVTSFFMPPEGQIDPSVITASYVITGQLALYVAMAAIYKGYDAKISKDDGITLTNNK